MGFAGNYEPNYIVPTLISVASDKKATGPSGGGGVGQQSAADTNIPDLDFYIGDQASQSHSLPSPPGTRALCLIRRLTPLCLCLPLAQMRSV